MNKILQDVTTRSGLNDIACYILMNIYGRFMNIFCTTNIHAMKISSSLAVMLCHAFKEIWIAINDFHVRFLTKFKYLWPTSTLEYKKKKFYSAILSSCKCKFSDDLKSVHYSNVHLSIPMMKEHSTLHVHLTSWMCFITNCKWRMRLFGSQEFIIFNACNL